MGNTTSAGIYYPDPTGTPRRAELQLMAESVDAALSISDVQSGAAAGGWTAAVSVQKLGRTVFLKGAVIPPVGTGALGYTTCAYLPVGYRPVVTETTQAAPVFGSTTNYSFVISPGGVIQVRISGTLPGPPMPALVFPPMTWIAA